MAVQQATMNGPGKLADLPNTAKVSVCGGGGVVLARTLVDPGAGKLGGASVWKTEHRSAEPTTSAKSAENARESWSASWLEAETGGWRMSWRRSGAA
jgi:hypothetical protein